MMQLSKEECTVMDMRVAYDKAKCAGDESPCNSGMTAALRVVQAQHEQEMQALKEKCLEYPVTYEEHRKATKNAFSKKRAVSPWDVCTQVLLNRLAALAPKAEPTLREQIGDAIAPYIGSSLDVDKAAQAVEELLERRKKGPAIS
jgi:hypothetical protein